MQSSPVPFPSAYIQLKTTKKTDLVKAFREHIVALDKNGFTNEVASFLTETNNLRDRIDPGRVTLLMNQKGQMATFNADADLILRYTKRIEKLDERFQTIGSSGKAAKTEFRWTDSFTDKEQTHCALGFEIASMLFNYSRICYFQGIQTISSSLMDKLKDSLRYLKQAVWSIETLLAYLPKSVGKLTFTGDISPPSLFLHLYLYKGAAATTLYHIALVSGIFNEKETAEVLKVIATNFFQCKTIFQQEQKHPLNNKKNLKMKFAVEYLFAVFHSLCLYFRSKEFENEHRGDNFGGFFGMKLGCLIEAQATMSQFNAFRKSNKDLEKSFTDQEKQFLSFLEKAILDDLNATTQKNESIYKQPVIKGNQLPEIKRLELKVDYLKPNPPPVWAESVFDESALEVFRPQELIKYRNELTTEIQELQSSVEAEIQELKKKKDMIVESTGLNQFIYFDSTKQSEQTIPPEIYSKREVFLKNGGINTLEHMVKSNEKERERLGRVMVELRERLDQEAAIDTSMRMKYGEKWSRIPSDKSGREWIEKLNCTFPFDIF